MLTAITDSEFRQIQSWLYGVAGISLSDQKKALVMGRLNARLKRHQLNSYGEYFNLLTSGIDLSESQLALDLLTTNETHFFRELKHFDFLREHILSRHPPRRTMRIWSAACSTGEEPYSIAMTLLTCLGEVPWEVHASDLSSRVLERARAGHYSMQRAASIPQPYLTRYCLKGIGAQDGTFLIDDQLRKRVHFSQINLSNPLPSLGQFDVIFLRNVMIYFQMETKRQLIERIIPLLSPGGYLFIGHSESLNGISSELKLIKPAIYRKP